MTAAPMSRAAIPTRVGAVRWSICVLLFFAATINYLDRQVIGLLKPTLQQAFGWTEIDYGDIVFAFTFAYAIGYVVAGRMMDQLGTRRGFALALVVWSVAAMAHANATTYGPAVATMLGLVGLKYGASVAGFLAARFMLGIGESGSFPASIKTVAEWFPNRERALATGIFNAGTNVGAVVAPLTVPWIALRYGWQWAFVITGAIGFAWLIAWLAMYDSPDRQPRLGAEELAYIRSDHEPAAPQIAWTRLLSHRETWAYGIAKFLTDSIWWLYLFWAPDFFTRTHGLSLAAIGAPLLTIYLIADVGSVAGGWLSSTLIKRGQSVNVARKMTMLACAVAVVPIIMAPRVRGLWAAVALVALAAAAHQGWSANLFTVAADTFPREAVGSVTGIGGTAGAIGGMLLAKAVGTILETTGSYLLVFAIPCVAYLFALAVLHALAPRLQRVTIR